MFANHSIFSNGPSVFSSGGDRGGGEVAHKLSDKSDDSLKEVNSVEEESDKEQEEEEIKV